MANIAELTAKQNELSTQFNDFRAKADQLIEGAKAKSKAGDHNGAYQDALQAFYEERKAGDINHNIGTFDARLQIAKDT